MTWDEAIRLGVGILAAILPAIGLFFGYQHTARQAMKEVAKNTATPTVGKEGVAFIGSTLGSSFSSDALLNKVSLDVEMMKHNMNRILDMYTMSNERIDDIRGDIRCIKCSL